LRFVTPDGQIGAMQEVPSDNLMSHPAVASNARDECLLVWQQFNGEYFDVRGRVLKVSGTAVVPDTLANSPLDVMSGDETLGLAWARGGRIGLAWTGSGYVVCQSVYAKYLDPKGRTVLDLTRTWNAYSPGGHTAVAAWGRGSWSTT